MCIRDRLKSIWYGDKASLDIKEMRSAIIEVHANYKQPIQQDAQEFVYVMLHELNIGLNKPDKSIYMISINERGKSNEEISRLYWNNFLAESQSIITDLMYGQFKSTLYCSHCRQYTTTFDHFSVLPLSLPLQSDELVRIVFVPYYFGLSALGCIVGVKDTDVGKFKESLSLIHICRCRRYAVCRSRWSPYH
eukprot:TRINITY_DN24848_c0_g1_i1.p1 TRINITY_DN24848_c0_g1~~TRINITY_DN24848_c0_g1_i1.p1  ORF type:complete len:192 (-),score=35.87 TRINITY_DN24848_c0_g1_i1:11-586(-)